MKLLILTQSVDKNNPVLGFFHRWLKEFSKHYESLIVICLEKGDYDLPANVKVFSLGKELGYSKFKKLLTFYYLLFTLRKQYDAVFVHMNQEYVLLGWDSWKLMGKKIYLWRNHAKGNLLTRMAVLFSDKVFCTSPSSYTARFKKTVIMPVGIDTEFFKPDPTVSRIPNSVLFLGRISPVKKVVEFVEWLKTTNYTATIAGPVGDEKYWESLKLKVESLKLKDRIRFVGPVTQEEALKLYRTHEIYVNLTPAGSMDKTIFEALACGCKLEVRNPDVGDINMEKQSLRALSVKLQMEIQ